MIISQPSGSSRQYGIGFQEAETRRNRPPSLMPITASSMTGGFPFVKEEYVKEMIKEVPIPAIVLMLLNDFRRSVSFQTADLTRDENAT